MGIFKAKKIKKRENRATARVRGPTPREMGASTQLLTTTPSCFLNCLIDDSGLVAGEILLD